MNEPDTPPTGAPVPAPNTPPPAIPDTNRPLTFRTVMTTGWTSYVAVTVALGLVLLATIAGAKYYVGSKAKELTKDFSLATPTATCGAVTDPEKLKFVTQEENDIVRYANAHRETAIEFYSSFYSTFAVFSIFGLFALLSGVVIAKSGYNNASPHLITVFLVSSGVVLIYQGFFGVFQQKANVDNNAKLFTAYSRLLAKMDTYCSTGKIPVIDPATVFNATLVQPKSTSSTSTSTSTSTPASPLPSPSPKPATFYIALEPDEFINYVGWQIEQLKSIAIAFDDTKVVALTSDKLLVLPQ